MKTKPIDLSIIVRDQSGGLLVQRLERLSFDSNVELIHKELLCRIFYSLLLPLMHQIKEDLNE